MVVIVVIIVPHSSIPYKPKVSTTPNAAPASRRFLQRPSREILRQGSNKNLKVMHPYPEVGVGFRAYRA